MGRYEKVDTKELFKANYKVVLESLLDNLSMGSLAEALGNENIPFEYCENVLKRKKRLSWKVKLAIALRSDCPETVFLKLCRKATANFTREITRSWKVISEDAYRLLYKASKDNLTFLLGCSDLPDDLRVEILDKFVELDDHGNVVYLTESNACVSSFIERQESFPEECHKVLDGVVAYLRKKKYKEEYLEMMLDNIELMRIPVNEEYAREAMNDWVHHHLLTLAQNPSIPDYMMVELLAKAPEECIEFVNRAFGKGKAKREEYRKAHPQNQ